MSKLSVDELVQDVQSELVTFLQQGTINEQDVVSTLDFTDLDIENFDRLKRIHFCLSDPVVEFVNVLPDRVRSIKTSNQRERVQTRGEIRGGVDWNQTMKLRHTSSYGDRTLFACESPYAEYDIPENLVLKRLLWLLQRTAVRELSTFDYTWRRESWSDETIQDFDLLYSQNIHINRIRDGNRIVPTSRDLTAARTSREPLYTEAYDLYDTYQQLEKNRFEDQTVQDVLRDTLVVPERIPRLFELFCVFKLIRSLSDLYPQLSLQTIELDAKEIARLENDEYRIEVYHDKQGSLTFHESPDVTDTDSKFMSRYLDVLNKHTALMDEFLSKDVNQSLYSGRPDIVVEIYDKQSGDESLRQVLLGEIKYTESEQTFSRGLKELLEYTRFARRSGTNLREDQFTDICGLLITDGINTTTSRSNIRHLTADRLSNVTEVIGSLVGNSQVDSNDLNHQL